MKSRWFLTVLGVAMAGLMAVGCGGEKKEEKKADAAANATAAAPAKKLVLGVAGAHSGDIASYGLPTLNAAKLVAKELNAKGGVNGMQVEVLAMDDQCKPELATNAATKLVSEKVAIVVGHTCSGPTKAALPIYKDAKVVVMSPSATSTELTQVGNYPNFFRTISYDLIQGKAAAEFAMSELKVKKVAIIHDKGDYGKGFAESAQKTFADGKTVTVALFEGITTGGVDYSAVVQKIKASGADCVLYGGYYPEASKIITQMHKKGVKIHFISDDGVKDDTFIKTAGVDAEGAYATGPQVLADNEVFKKAAADHEKEFGSKPGAFFPQAYAAAQALLNAVAKAGSTDYDKVVAALHSELIETPVGKIKFDAKGDAEGASFSVYQVKNGKYELVK
ncbi:MAG: branched-chain amino acid ABC transporter substrate-binding protein [Humidesulfovibrio sp.]|uniref:branched-chain amino acid ABC transporter substrate-binding protein n=1 Tax=Humidesulfovibrio sp. TaxID=2910988 RepID=UPI002732DC57|nr:branched-chain amino acid ABC transporter substrate-binding protein [Humidesulfovibrio sp.]MDP2848695.1 branched-chain amino acid ABC transporter substrate-binding protein [Humidesulfovibrio sp.]